MRNEKARLYDGRTGLLFVKFEQKVTRLNLNVELRFFLLIYIVFIFVD